MKIKLLLLVFTLFIVTAYTQDSLQTFLPISNTGVAEFHQLYPEYDGRGTIILVLDTGVDMGIDGLTKTTTGDIKVIDVQDFTGEGDVQLYEAEIDEEDDKQFFINEETGYKIFGADKLTYHAVDDKYFIGAFKESGLINSSSRAADLNGNGSENDEYIVIAFKTMVEEDQFWIAYMDTDGDKDISDEFAHRNYKDDLQSFTIKMETGLAPLTMGINIFPDEKRVSIHFDDGAHGTHVAGIAAGNDIGETGLTGIAPGAYVISLKLGNNLYTGGATITESMKKAYLYADKISRERKETCIINMSFGIGSEIEGRAEMEKFLAELVKDNPYLYICTSNGNDGPGISTAGLPAASEFVLSSGAVLTTEVARDLYGTGLENDIILYFSSRGGEVSKPDVCSPGASTSTVPNWARGDRFWGTSMASPYSAGVASLLLSAMKVEFPDVKIPSLLVYNAIRESSTKMEGYSYLDQGSGYINVVNAFNLLKKYIENGEVNKFETYSITSTAPNMPDGKASNLYLRNGSFITGNEKFNFTVRRNNFQNTDKFYRVYNLKCSEDWLIPVQQKIYIRNNQSAVVTVKFDKKKMTEPGLYSGKIKAYRDDKSKFPEFEMLATVVIPYEFSLENNYERSWTDKKIDVGQIDRYFINLPAGQTTMKISLSRNEKEYAMTRFRVFDPDGIELDGSSVLYSVDGDNVVDKYYYILSSGVYEVDVEGYFRAEYVSQYNFGVKFFGIDRMDEHQLSVDDNTLLVINNFNNAIGFNLSGKILGYERKHKVELKGYEHFKLPFTFNPGESSKEFILKLTKEDFNLVTDFAFLIYDQDGIAVSSNGLSYSEGSISVINDPENTQYTLELIPAFTHAEGEMVIEVIENTEFTDQESFNVNYAGSSNFTLYPNIPTELNCEFGELTMTVPADGKLYGKIYLESASNKKVETEMLVYISLPK